jgi:diguanylate cyclase (GGDEF)-like protein
MSPLVSLFAEWIESLIDFYHESPLCRAICAGLTLFFGLLLIDAVAGFPTGTRMAYVLPLWIATKRGSRTAGATLVLVITMSLALIDSTRQDRSSSLLVNFVLQTSVLYALMLIFDGLENKLRDVTNLATRDSLTGLYNRFAIEERARKAIDRAVVMDQPLTIAMVDCDRFKELNDQFGHAFGDEVLRLLSKTMRRSFYGDSIVGRSGGDEFIVLMPNRDRVQALAALEASLDRFMSHAELVGRTTGFSYGVATVGDCGFEYDRLIRAADEDMYRRKADRSGITAELAS